MRQHILTAALVLTVFILKAERPLYLDPNAPIESRVDNALSLMTLDEKISLLHAHGKFFSGGVPRLGIPGLWHSDGPHGVRAEISWNSWKYADQTNDSVTAFPALTALAATWNPALAELYGRALGEEALYRGKNVMLGPGVNICRTPLNGRNFEYMGEDPFLAAEMVEPYIKGLQSNGVAACVKHFALNNQEKYRMDVDVTVGPRALHEIYLPAFKRAVDAGAWAIMGSYNRVDGEHGCHNHRLLVDLLRHDWGFDGVVISDWGGTHDTRQAALNGLDIEMGSYTNGLTSESAFTFDDYFLARPYRQMIERGELTDSSLNAKAANVLRLIFRTSMNPSRGFGSLCSPEHYAAAKAIGDESIVLLKNNGLLPLDPAKYRRVLVVGDNATRHLNQGGGSSELKVKDMFTPLEALAQVFDTVDYQPGYYPGRPRYNKEDVVAQAVQDSLRALAVARAADYDAVIYIGGLNKNGFQDAEATDRYQYNLPWGQDKLIEELLKANPNTVVFNISGNAYQMPWIDRAPAVLQGWYLGTMIGPTMADVITGRVNPSGKLPFSFPRRLADNGAIAMGELSYPGVVTPDSLHRQEYLEDILVGYRWHDTKKIPALFPFGHGLSYTTFEYGEPVVTRDAAGATVTPLVITVPVTNTGAVAGSEVVQLYISDLKSSLPRPVKELKHFVKVDLGPGQTGQANFIVTEDDLRFYDDRSGRWVVEPGRFKALIGSSSTDIRASVPFTY